MRRRLQRSAALAAVLVACVAVAGCPENPYSVDTWVKKLDDARELDRAVDKLEQLGNPKAIAPLGEAWLKQARPPRILQVIIELSPALDQEAAKKKNLTDYEKTGRQSSWNAALPYLVAALKDVDENNPRSVESAIKAAAAIGDAGLDEGLDVLIEFSQRAGTKKILPAQATAVRALGNFDNAGKSRAVAALIKLVDQPPPPNPRTVARDAETRPAMEEAYRRHLAMTGAAINSLGSLRASEAAKVLVMAMYRSPELFGQVRRALVASGSGVVGELRKILRDEHPEVKQLFKEKKLDRYCGDRNDLPPDQCVPVSAKDFYAAIVLGDFYDPESVPDLLAALKRPAVPAYYVDEQPSGTQHGAIFDSLRKIGSSDGAEPLMGIWSDGKSDLAARLGAVSAFGFVARGDTGLDRLAKIIEDNGENGDLRLEAATTYARLASSTGAISLMQQMAAKYAKEAAEDRAKADGEPKKTADKAEESLKAARKLREEAKVNLEKVSRNPDATADQIREATEAATKQEEATKAAEKRAREDGSKYRSLDRTAKQRQGIARTFQTHIARIEIAMRCKDDVSCYTGTLKAKTEDVVAKLGPHIKDFKSWTEEEKAALPAVQVERAMLEVGKRGQKAAGQAATLLEATKSDNFLIRQSILLALPKVVKVPCEDCEPKLDEALKAGAGKSTLADLNLETEMLRNYFSWAGGRTPGKLKETPAEDPGAK